MEANQEEAEASRQIAELENVNGWWKNDEKKERAVVEIRGIESFHGVMFPETFPSKFDPHIMVGYLAYIAVMLDKGEERRFCFSIWKKRFLSVTSKEEVEFADLDVRLDLKQDLEQKNADMSNFHELMKDAIHCLYSSRMAPTLDSKKFMKHD